MENFEYDITRHDAETFMQMVYFCSEQGDCKLEEIPAEEPQMLTDLLNTRGRDGWELVAITFIGTVNRATAAYFKRPLP